MKIKTLYILLIALLLFGFIIYFVRNSTNISENKSVILSGVGLENVNFLTIDNVYIAGDWYNPVNSNGKAVLLLHMMNRDRSSWNEFIQILTSKGFSVLVIDLRGHGDSIIQKTANKNIKLDYRQFSDAEHQLSIRDINASLDFIRMKGIQDKDISLLGASIGANLTLQALVQNEDIKTAVLLSPGIDYRGINALVLAGKINKDQQVLLLASESDKYSAESVQKIYQIASSQMYKYIFTNPQTGHGTDMFQTEPDLSTRVVQWLLNN